MYSDELTEVEDPVQDAPGDENPTLVSEPFLLSVRKLEALPAGDAEQLELAREQLHDAVDHLVDRALDSVQALQAMVERTVRQRDAMGEELEFVVRHSNALVAQEARPRRDTLVDMPVVQRLLRAV